MFKRVCLCVSVFLCAGNLQNWNVIVDLSAVFLSDALGNPNNVAAFLFLELQIRIENAKVELLHKCVDIQFDLEKKGLTRKIGDKKKPQTSCSKNLSSKVLSPGLLPDPSNRAAYSA